MILLMHESIRVAASGQLYLPMCVILMRLLGMTSTPSLNHLPVTFSSDTSHLKTACSAAFSVRSAILCKTSSSFSIIEKEKKKDNESKNKYRNITEIPAKCW